MSKLSEIFNREIDLIKKDENTLGIVLVGSSKDLDFEKDIKIKFNTLFNKNNLLNDWQYDMIFKTTIVHI